MRISVRSHSKNGESKWIRTVAEKYSAASTVWTQENSAASSDLPKFWELDLSIDETTLRDAAVEIAKMISSSSVVRGTASASLVLFHLLRTRLTNIRSNRLWPEVARELSVLSGKLVEASKCGTWFRGVIWREYENRLEDLHNKYVAFSLDEAGVGRDRSSIVSAFLESLIVSGLGSNLSEDELDARLSRYVAGSVNRADVEALLPVLRRSGIALCELAGHFRSARGQYHWSLWEWDELREYWLRHSGVDLNRLLPEARMILGRFVNRLGDRISRAGISRLIADGELAVTFPKSLSSPTASEDPRSLPLTPVLLADAKHQRAVLVCDESGMTADEIVATPPDTWHRGHGDYLSIWRRHRFVINTGTFGVERSAPLVTGGNIQDCNIVGEFWSGRATATAMPRLAGSSEVPKLPTRLIVSAGWYLNELGIVLRLHWFETSSVEYSGAAQVTAERVTLWKGVLEDGVPASGKSEPFVFESVEALGPKLQFRLVSEDGRILCETLLNNPLGREIAPVIRGRILSGKTEYSASKSEFQELYPGGVYVIARSKPQASGCRLEEVRQAVKEWRLYRLELEDHGSGSAILRGKESLVRFQVVQPVGIDSEAPSAVQIDGLEVRGLGGVRPVRADEPMSVRLSGWSFHGSMPANLLRTSLFLQVGAFTSRLPFQEVMTFTTPDRDNASGSFSVLSVLRAVGLKDPIGLINVSLEGPAITENARLAFFRLGGTIDYPASRIGQVPEIIVNRNSPLALRISANDSYQYEDAREGKYSTCSLFLGGGLGITLTWVPTVIDAVFLSGETVVDGIVNAEILTHDCKLALLDRNSGHWTVRVPEHEGTYEGGRTVASSELLEFFGASPLKTRFEAICNGSVVRAWSIDLTPIRLDAQLDWEQSRSSRLRMRASWFGLPSQILEFRLCVENMTAAKPFFTERSEGLFSIERRVDWQFDLSPLAETRAQSGVPAFIEVINKGDKFCQLTIPSPPSTDHTLAPEDLKGKIKHLLSSLSNKQDDGPLLQNLLYLNEYYMRTNQRLPFPAGPIIDQIRSRSSGGCLDDVVLGFHLLEHLSNGKPARLVMRDPESGGRLALFLLSLEVINEVRLSHIGQARPEILDKLEQSFSHIAADLVDRRLRAWSNCMRTYCMHSAGAIKGQVERPAYVTKDDTNMALDEPVVGFDAELNTWLRTLTCLEVSNHEVTN